MATLDQLKAALIKADAAGNAADAKVFANAIRSMQGQPAADPQATPPVHPFKVGSGPGPIKADPMSGVLAATDTVGEIPIVGPFVQRVGDFLTSGAGALATGKSQEQVRQDIEDARARRARENRLVHGVGTFAANVAPYALPGAGAVAGLSGKLIPDLGKAALSAQGLFTGDQLVRGNSGVEATGYGVPALAGMAGRGAGELVTKMGGAIAKAVTGSAQRKLTDAAIKGAPPAADLYRNSKALFQQVDNSGVTVDTGRFSSWLMNLVRTAKGMRINENLNPGAHSAFKELIGALDDVTRNGGALTVGDIHTLRQIAQDAAVKAKPRDAMFANMIVDGLDDFIGKPGVLKLPPNILGNGNQAQVGNQLLEAISLWSKGRKVSLIEKAIQQAENYPSGLESGLRNQFSSLLKSKGHLFTDVEKDAMRRVVKGTLPVAALRALGIFKGMGSTLLGAVSGAGAGPLGVAAGLGAGALAGAASRKITGAATEAAANRAAQVVGTTRRIPIAPPAPNLLAPAAMPIDLLLRGGLGG